MRYMKNQYDSVLQDFEAGYWQWKMLDNTLYFSDRFKAFLGYEDNAMPDMIENFKTIIFNEDAQLFFQKLNEHLNSNGKIPFVMKLRYLHNSGILIDVV